MAAMRTVLFLLCLLSGTAALAQAPEAADAPVASPAPPPFGLQLGKPLRIVRGGLMLEGRLLELDERSLTLVGPDQTQRERILLTDVQSLSIRKHSAARGALIGGGVGFLAGMVTGMYFCGLAEYSNTGECLALGAIVGSVFGLPGMGLGALVGLAIPHWERVYGEELTPFRLRGQLGLLVSSIFGMSSPLSTLNPGVRVQLLGRLGTHVALGPELAVHYLLQPMYRFPLHKPVVSLGLLMRAVPLPGVLEPSILAGIAAHPADTVRPTRYSLGVGLDRKFEGGRPLSLELRWHHSGVPWRGKGGLITLDVGTRFSR